MTTGVAARGSRKQASIAAANRLRPIYRLSWVAWTKLPCAARLAKNAVPMVAGPAAAPSWMTVLSTPETAPASAACAPVSAISISDDEPRPRPAP